MNKKDEQIIAVLQENSRLSSQQIAKKTLIPVTTVHNRLKKLVKEGVIKRFTIDLDYKKIGRPIASYILLTVDYKELKAKRITQHDLAKKLYKHSNVVAVSMLTGTADIIIKVRVADVEELDSLVTIELRNIQGIKSTQTSIILNELG